MAHSVRSSCGKLEDWQRFRTTQEVVAAAPYDFFKGGVPPHEGYPCSMLAWDDPSRYSHSQNRVPGGSRKHEKKIIFAKGNYFLEIRTNIFLISHVLSLQITMT